MSGTSKHKNVTHSMVTLEPNSPKQPYNQREDTVFYLENYPKEITKHVDQQLHKDQRLFMKQKVFIRTKQNKN